jgi:hypothetical protein
MMSIGSEHGDMDRTKVWKDVKNNNIERSEDQSMEGCAGPQYGMMSRIRAWVWGGPQYGRM